MHGLLSQLGYIGEHDTELDSCYNPMALEASIRAIEDDTAIPPYHPEHLIDLRQYDHLETVASLRTLIRKPEFCLDLIKTPAPVQYGYTFKTLYGRSVTKGFMDNRRMIQSSKGLIVLDEYVTTELHADPEA